MYRHSAGPHADCRGVNTTMIIAPPSKLPPAPAPAAVPVQVVPPAASPKPSFVTPGQSQPFTDFQKAENANSNNLGVQCSVSVPRNLTKRKIYAWVFAGGASATVDWILKASLVLSQGGSVVSKIPISLAGSAGTGSTITQSVETVCVSGGNAGVDAIGIYVGQPITGDGQPLKLILQPFYVTGEIDQVSIVMDDWTYAEINYVRTYLAVVSSQS